MGDLNVNFNNSTFNFTFGGSKAEFPAELDKIRESILSTGASMSALMNALMQRVAENRDVINSAIVLIQGLKSKLDDAIASGDPAQLQALSDSLGQSDMALADAVAANTPLDGSVSSPPNPTDPSPIEDPAPAPVAASPQPVDDTPVGPVDPEPVPAPTPAPVEAPAPVSQGVAVGEPNPGAVGGAPTA